MKPLSIQNIESELSYAYIHAVCAQAGIGCKIGSRHDDNAGVDAQLTAWGPFSNGGYIEEVDIKVQLKATVQAATMTDRGLAYNFKGISQYNDLRADTVSIPRILVVLFLPTDTNLWLEHTKDALTLRNCAYWVSLRGAAESANQSSQTVYIPQDQCFDPVGLQSLIARLSRHDIPRYEASIS